LALKFKMHKPVRVAITGARGSVGTNLAFRVAMGDMFGMNQPVILQLYSRDCDALLGLRLELEDTCAPLLAGIVTSDKYEDVFGDADYACLVGSPPRTQGMERADLLKVSGELFKHEGAMLGQYARPNCKVIVVGNPANTNAMIAAANAKNVPVENFTAMTRLDHNRALYQLATYLNDQPGAGNMNVHPSCIDGLIIWGNHSPKMYPDITNATVQGQKVLPLLPTGDWVKNTFIPRVQQRGKEIIDARGSSSAPSAAMACVDQMRDWALGSQNNWVSMAVMSGTTAYGVDSYGIESGLMFSYPVVCQSGDWKVVPGLPMDAFARKMIQQNIEELKSERDAVRNLL